MYFEKWSTLRSTDTLTVASVVYVNIVVNLWFHPHVVGLLLSIKFIDSSQ